MKKTKAIIIAFSSLVVSTLSLSALTFAWIDMHKEIPVVNLDTGSLSINNLSTTAYKYVYPYFADTTLIDYFGNGTVTPYTISAATPNVSMNIFDPTYLAITKTGDYTNQSYVSEMYTNLVLKVSFSVTYSTPISLSFKMKQNSSYVAASGHFRASPYLYFYGLTSTVFDSLTTDKTEENDIIFYKVKSYAESQTLVSGQNFLASTSSTDASLSFFSADLVTTQPEQATTATFVSYLCFDYYNPNCGLFYDANHLGFTYDLDHDFAFYLSVNQALQS